VFVAGDVHPLVPDVQMLADEEYIVACILLVDDSKFQRTINMRVLVKAGYRVVVAGDGEEAIALISQEAPDLIVLDLLLPKMSGIDVIRALKQNSRTASIPVVVLSGLSEKNGAKLLREGATAYLEKSRLEGKSYEEEFLRITKTLLPKATIV
jgi:CheY-like chemotaxis protein